MATNYIQDLENYVTNKGYVTSSDLESMQFEIGEKQKEKSPIYWDIYTDILKGYIYTNEGGYEIFDLWRANQQALDDSEDEEPFLEEDSEADKEFLRETLD